MVVKGSAGAIEGEGVSGVAFAIPVEYVRGVHLAVQSESREDGWVENVCSVFCDAKVFHDVVQIAVVLVCGMAALCAGEGDGGHDVWATLGEVEKNAE